MQETVLRSCFEFLQKVFLGLMYPFSCVLWEKFKTVSSHILSSSYLSKDKLYNRLDKKIMSFPCKINNLTRNNLYTSLQLSENSDADINIPREP